MVDTGFECHPRRFTKNRHLYFLRYQAILFNCVIKFASCNSVKFLVIRFKLKMQFLSIVSKRNSSIPDKPYFTSTPCVDSTDLLHGSHDSAVQKHSADSLEETLWYGARGWSWFTPGRTLLGLLELLQGIQ